VRLDPRGAHVMALLIDLTRRRCERGYADRVAERARATTGAMHIGTAVDTFGLVDLAQTAARAVAARAALAVAIRIVVGPASVLMDADAMALADAFRFALAHAVRGAVRLAHADGFCGAASRTDDAQRAWLAARFDGSWLTRLRDRALLVALALAVEVETAFTLGNGNCEVDRAGRVEQRFDLLTCAVARARSLRIRNRVVRSVEPAPRVFGSEIACDIGACREHVALHGRDDVPEIHGRSHQFAYPWMDVEGREIPART